MRCLLAPKIALSSSLGFMTFFISACNLAEVTQTPQYLEVTREVPKLVIITHIVKEPQIIVVTEFVVITQIVEVPWTIEPVPTEAPIQFEVPTAVNAPEPTKAPPAPTEAPTAPFPRNPIEPLVNNDLLVWYDFESDFALSGVVADRSGNGIDAQVIGPVNETRGISGGQAISLTGNGYIQALMNPGAGRKSVTFSLWFKTDHPEANYKLASAAWWAGGPGSGWILATHIPEFWSEDTNSLYLPGTVSAENDFPSDEWIHEVVTYDGNRIREYTNGQLVNDWLTTGAAIGPGQAMAIGAWPMFPGYNFQGSIDEFKIYSWSLTRDEVQQLYDNEQ